MTPGVSNAEMEAGGLCAPDSSPRYRLLDGDNSSGGFAWRTQLPSSRHLPDKGLTRYENSQFTIKLDISFTIRFSWFVYAYSVRMSLWDLVFEMASFVPHSPWLWRKLGPRGYPTTLAALARNICRMSRTRTILIGRCVVGDY